VPAKKKAGRKPKFDQNDFDYIIDKKGVPVSGIYEGLGFDQYRKAWAIANSDLLRLEESPRKYKFQQENPKPQTKAMAFGTALHTIVLEPEKFNELYIPDAYTGSYSKDAKAWREEQKENDITVINNKDDPEKGVYGMSDWDRLHYMRDAVLAHPTLSILLGDGGQSEVSIFWKEEETGLMCKCRVDYLPYAHNIAIDLKSTEDATMSEFQYSMFKYGYVHQDAHYSDGLYAHNMIRHFIFAAIEKEPPFEIGLYTVSKEDRDFGYTRRNRNLLKMQDCIKNNNWSGITEDVREINLAPYQRKMNIT